MFRRACCYHILIGEYPSDVKMLAGVLEKFWNLHSLGDPQMRSEDQFGIEIADSSRLSRWRNLIWASPDPPGVFVGSLEDFPSDSILEFVRELDASVGVRTGYGYRMFRGAGPEWYSVGVNMGLIPMFFPTRQRARNWSWRQDFGEEKSYLGKRLRNVYEFNLMTRKHWELSVKGVGLDRFCRNEGVVRQVCEGVWAWELDASRVGRVRKLFREENLVIECC